MKVLVINVKCNRLVVLKLKIKGNNRVSSTSKIIKITAIKKNCREKGIRALFFGSNPHSKGLFFSRSEKVFFEVKFKIIVIIVRIRLIIRLI